MKKSSNEVNQSTNDCNDPVCFSEDQKEIIDAIKKLLELPTNKLKRIIIQGKAGKVLHHISFQQTETYKS
jgi:hypothetical protein